MKITKSILIYLLFICVASLLSACGSDDGGEESVEGKLQFEGKTTAVAVTQDNAQAITEAAVQSIDRDRLMFIYDNVVAMLIEAKGGISAKAEAVSTCGGSVNYPDNLGSSNPLVGTLTFTDFCIEKELQQLTINGTIDFDIQLANNVELVTAKLSINVEISQSGKSKTLDGEIIFADNKLEIIVNSDFTGTDERVYRVENLSISTDVMAATIMIKSGRFYDPDLGYVDIHTGVNLPLTFSCASGAPSSGTLVITGNDDTNASVEFLNCSQYQVCMDNMCNSHSW